MLRKISELSVGVRFSYPEFSHRVYVLTDCWGCGACTEWKGIEKGPMIGAYSVAESEEEFQNLEVIVVC